MERDHKVIYLPNLGVFGIGFVMYCIQCYLQPCHSPATGIIHLAFCQESHPQKSARVKTNGFPLRKINRSKVILAEHVLDDL